VKLAVPVGVHCKDDHHAKIVADQVAKQIAIDVETEGERNIVVVDAKIGPVSARQMALGRKGLELPRPPAH
jgi:hypothetical protein